MAVTEMYLVACLLPGCVERPVVGAAARDIVTVRTAAEGLGYTFIDFIDADTARIHLGRLSRCPGGHATGIHRIAAVLPCGPTCRPHC